MVCAWKVNSPGFVYGYVIMVVHVMSHGYVQYVLLKKILIVFFIVRYMYVNSKWLQHRDCRVYVDHKWT